MQRNPANNRQADTFICHASEDKGAIARPLHEALTNAGVNSWLDESDIRLGQSIRQSIDHGLANCRSAAMILSRPFFEKIWPQYEMDGIIGRANQGQILLFPIQHGITIEEIRSHSPSLAGLSMWNSTQKSPEEIAIEIADQLGISSFNTPEPIADQREAPGARPAQPVATRTFGTFYVAPANTPELSPRAQPETDPRWVYSILGTPEGWIPVLHSNVELEYVIEDNLLRIQLAWGSTRQGTEIAASQVMCGRESFAVTIRKPDGTLEYFPSVTNRSPSNFLMDINPSGWMSFQIG